ncbi:MAG: hypothetical protein IPJ30_14585 [Acidobacteria bacterium]|nr:hypothetical protein [Acidobacteriota bacterium]
MNIKDKVILVTGGASLASVAAARTLSSAKARRRSSSRTSILMKLKRLPNASAAQRIGWMSRMPRQVRNANPAMCWKSSGVDLVCSNAGIGGDELS